MQSPDWISGLLEQVVIVTLSEPCHRVVDGPIRSLATTGLRPALARLAQTGIVVQGACNGTSQSARQNETLDRPSDPRAPPAQERQ